MRKFALLIAMIMASGPAYAEFMAHDVEARLGIGDRPGVMFVSLHNMGEATELVAAESASFERIELHTHEHENGMMRMVKVETFTLPANSTLELKPGGDHLMLFGYSGAVGNEVTVNLRFADGRTLDVSAITETRGKKMHKMKMQGHSGHHGH